MDQTTTRLGLIFALAAALFSMPPLCQADHLTTQISGEIGIIGGSVSRSAFTEAVVNREPKNRITELLNNKQYIYYFSEVKGMTGQTVTHRWLLNGNPMSEFKFNVGSTRWRIWSSMALKREWLGKWEVQVVDELDRVIHSDSFNYIEAAASPLK